jgi:hypothetical protein
MSSQSLRDGEFGLKERRAKSIRRPLIFSKENVRILERKDRCEAMDERRERALHCVEWRAAVTALGPSMAAQHGAQVLERCRR